MCTDLRYSLFIYIYGFRFERNFKRALTFDGLCLSKGDPMLYMEH